MDVTQLISPIVSALIAVFGAYTATKKASEDRERERDAKQNERDIEIKTELASMGTEIRLLSERVEKHNNVIERVYKLEGRVDTIEQKGAVE